MTVPVDWWESRLAGARNDDVALSLTVVLGRAADSGSRAFPATLSDGQTWWVKPQNSQQGPTITVSEFVVAACGQVIGAPTCRVASVLIPADFAGYQVENGVVLEAGVASASLEVPNVFELRSLEHRDRDDNAVRHAGVVAMYDWCWGDDPQWLYDGSKDNALHSHDHGYYLPPGGPQWDAGSLASSVDLAHPVPDQYGSVGLSASELLRLAAALESVSREDLLKILAAVPASWPVGDFDLERLGWFLERRAPQVGARIRQLHATLWPS